jgi:Protein of unknown function (DUF3089)
VARKFLYLIAILIILVFAAALAFRLYGSQLIRFAMVPPVEFTAPPPLPPNRYADAKLWHSRPGIANDPALWTPPGFTPEAPRGDAAIFFIHPTSYLDVRPSSWNAGLDNAETNERAQLFIRGQASVFNGVGEIWAPRYRQAAFGAFLTTQREAQQALDAAYADVVTSFDAFVAAQPPGRPIIVAGHSQGAVHLLRLLRERVATQPLATRIVAAYVIGWPVSRTADLPSLGLPACTAADQPRCVLSWASYAEPADTSPVIAGFDAATGPTGIPRKGTSLLCINPLTGTPDSTAAAAANAGAVIPAGDLKTGTLVKGTIPARCDGAEGGRGFLLIGPPPEGINAYVLPGNNYHVFDYSLFWSNIRADAARRLAAFKAK